MCEKRERENEGGFETPQTVTDYERKTPWDVALHVRGSQQAHEIDRCRRGDHPLSGLDGLARFSAILVGGLPD